MAAGAIETGVVLEHDGMLEFQGHEMRTLVVIIVGLIALVVAVYARTGSFEFLTWDDPAYVTDNPYVNRGVTREGVEWAFTNTLHGNWQPLTVISHMLDVDMFGMRPAGHHLENVALHAVNAVLLFLLLVRLTAAVARSALVAALFAVHPLNIETVAWIAERKSLLSLLFGLLAILSYVEWVRKPGPRLYVTFAGFFALSLMTKSMLVTLPVLLLILDVWPLRRVSTAGEGVMRLAEKWPAFALSLSCALVTVVAQRAAGAMSNETEIAFMERVANASFSLGWYLVKAVWPSGLNSLYLHPALAGRSHPVTGPVASGILLVAAGALMTRLARRPAWRLSIAGLVWYVVALLPVIGIIQVGYQARADRYAYVPLIGVFIAVAFVPVSSRAVLALGAVAVVTLGSTAFLLTRYWSDDRALYTRAVEIDDANWVMITNLAAMHLSRGEASAAVEYARRAISMSPSHAPAWANLGVALVQLERYGDAAPALSRAVVLDPSNQGAWRNLAAAESQTGRFRQSIVAARTALALQPDDALALYWLGLASENIGDRTTARYAADRMRVVAPDVARELLGP